MRQFYLYRKEDETGVSGKGFVAEGVVFKSGVICMSWLGETTSCTMYNSIDDVLKIHGHNGKTVIAWEELDFIDEDSNRLILDVYTGLVDAHTNEWLSCPAFKNKKRISKYLFPDLYKTSEF